jgi:hypothetical protein
MRLQVLSDFVNGLAYWLNLARSPKWVPETPSHECTLRTQHPGPGLHFLVLELLQCLTKPVSALAVLFSRQVLLMSPLKHAP